MPPLRLAFVGTGIAARELHWPALHQLSDFYQIVAVCNRTRAKAEAFGELIGLDLANVTTDYAEVLARPDVDVVSLLVPPQANRAMAEAAAGAGKHVIVEKPIATTLADARAIVDIPQRYGVQVLVAENMRYHGFLDPTIALVAGGAIGELFLVTWRYMSGLGPDNPYANTGWRQTPEHPGGFFSDVNVHTANGLRALAGEISRVHCLARQIRPWLGGLDTAVFNLEFQSGVIGTLTYSLAAAVERSMQLTLYGTTGTIEASWEDVVVRRPGHEAEIYPLTGPSSYVREYEDFYQALVHGRTPKMTALDGLRDLAVVLAALESAETGQAVGVPETEAG